MDVLNSSPEINFFPGSVNKSHAGNTISDSSDNGMIAGISILVSLFVLAAVGMVNNQSVHSLITILFYVIFRRYISATSILCIEI